MNDYTDEWIRLATEFDLLPKDVESKRRGLLMHPSNIVSIIIERRRKLVDDIDAALDEADHLGAYENDTAYVCGFEAGFARAELAILDVLGISPRRWCGKHFLVDRCPDE